MPGEKELVSFREELSQFIAHQNNKKEEAKTNSFFSYLEGSRQ